MTEEEKTIKEEEKTEEKSTKKVEKISNIPVCIVLGASSGLGLELGKQYYQNKKYNVILAARREKNLKEIVSEVKGKGENIIDYCVTDATDESSVKNLIDSTINLFGRIDVAIYCAGINSIKF
jgi:short-subunit dehydrogenase